MKCWTAGFGLGLLDLVWDCWIWFRTAGFGFGGMCCVLGFGNRGLDAWVFGDWGFLIGGGGVSKVRMGLGWDSGFGMGFRI